MFEVDFHILNQKATPAIYADDLALRPTAGFAGRIFINTASPYGVYRDTGSAWVQVASNGGGGGGSTGVNGLNGTTNIGLGGTLTGNTLISGASTFGLNFQNLFIFQANSRVFSFVNLDFANNSSEISSGNGNFLQLMTSNNVINAKSIQIIEPKKIKSTYQDINYGLNLDFGNQKFSIGDYDFLSGKKNSIIVDDQNSKIYLTTGKSSSNNDPDLLLAQNISTTNRLIKFGDISNSYGGITLEVNDGFGNPSLTTTFGGSYYGFQVTPISIDIGDYNGENSYTNLRVASSLSKIYTSFIDNNTLSQIDTGLSLDNALFEHKFGIFNYSINDNYLKINDRDIEFFCARDFKLTGSNIEDLTPGTIPLKALFIVVNGTKYKLNLY